MFRLVVYINNQAAVVGNVKIIELGLENGAPRIPDSFEALGPQFISLGQEHEYYEALVALGPEVYEPILTGLNDIVYRSELRSPFEEDRALRDSLLRFSGAVSAIETAPSLFMADRESEPELVDLRVATSVGGSEFEIGFEWHPTAEVPGRIAAVIGYNGTGKTQLLANLGLIAATTGVSVAAEGSAGRVLSNSITTFSGVIAVAYSAFDSFIIPSVGPSDILNETQRGSSFGYSYVGLRRHTTSAEETTEGGEEEYELKTSAELTEDFNSALTQAGTRDRVEALAEALGILMQEPSFIRAGLDADAFASRAAAIGLFRSLSSGHKLVMNVVVNLVALLQPRMLVLIDEPEAHLHPPLVAALLSAVRAALARFRSLAIVATHSPVVIQEIPSHNVRILRRIGTETFAESLDIESFAENIGHLTRTVFNLDSSATDFQRVLRGLASNHTASEIEGLFDQGLSQQGRALLARFYANGPDERS